MNKEDLKNKIEKFYVQSLNADNPELLIGLDAIKSILGISLDNINSTLLDWFSEYMNSAKLSINHLGEFTDIPGAISFYSLEEALLEKDKERASEAIFYLSKVSEGTQIFEFLLEFSLRHTETCFKYIWHIMRLEKLFNGKYRLESLNKCIELLIDEEYIDCDFSLLDCLSSWEEYLSLIVEKEENMFLYYTIYKSDLTRFSEIRRLIIGRLDKINKNHCSRININVNANQIKEGRLWITKYFGELKIDNIEFHQVILFDKIRSCLLLAQGDLETKLFWSHLNKNL